MTAKGNPIPLYQEKRFMYVGPAQSRFWFFALLIQILFFCGCGGGFLQGISERSATPPVSTTGPGSQATLSVSVVDGPLSNIRVRLVSLTRGTLATGKSNLAGDSQLSVFKSVLQTLPADDRLFIYADSVDSQSAVHFQDGSLRLLKVGQARLKSILPPLSVINAVNTTELTADPQIQRSSQVSHFSNAISLLTEAHLKETGVISAPLRPGTTITLDNLLLFSASVSQTVSAISGGSPVVLARFKLVSMANKAIIEEEFTSFLDGAPATSLESSDEILSQLAGNGSGATAPLSLSQFFQNSLSRLSDKISADLNSSVFSSTLASSLPLSSITSLGSAELLQNSTQDLAGEIETRVTESVRSSFSLTNFQVFGSTGNILASASLVNPLSQPVNLIFEYSIDGGVNFSTSTNISPALTVFKGSAQVDFTWSSLADTLVDTTVLVVRLKSLYSGLEATSATVGPLSLFNFPNRVPILQSVVISGDSGNLSLGFDLTDQDNDPLSVLFEYSLDGGSTFAGSANISPSLQNLSSGQNLSFTWNSSVDFQTNETSVLVRLTPGDPESSGIPVSSSSFIVFNRPNTAPTVENVLIQGDAGDLLVSMDVVDNEGDLVSVGFEYTTDSGVTFQNSQNLSRSLSSLSPAAGVTFVWSSLGDIQLDLPIVRLRLSPVDFHLLGDPLLTNPFSVNNQPNRSPVLSNLSLTPNDEDFAVSITVQDLDGDPVSILFEYSTDSGVNFSSTTHITPESLVFSPGVAGWTWRSGEDFSTNETSVLVRVTPNDGFVAGPSLLSSPFSALNNDLPTAVGASLSGTSGDLIVSVDLSDDDLDLLSLGFEYTTDGGSQWITSTEVDRALTGLPGISGTTFVWNSSQNFSSNESDVQIRITPSDGKQVGTSSTSSLFTILNNNPPIAQGVSASGTSGDLLISVDVLDADADLVSLNFEYTTDAGVVWISSTNLDRTLNSLIPQLATTFLWQSSQDFLTDETTVMIRTTPSDAQSSGTSSISNLFSVLNNHEPIAQKATVSGTSGDLLIGVDLIDEDSDLVSLSFEYSLNSGVSWILSQNLDRSLSSLIAQTLTTFVWNSSQDFLTDEASVQFRITPSDGKSSGTSAVSSSFAVFNNHFPIAQNATVIGTSDSILVSLDLIDVDQDLLSVTFEYSTDSGSAWILSQNLDRSLTSLPALTGTTFLWYSSLDFRTDETTMQIRLTPSDGKSTGTSAITTVFSVFNNHLPVSQNLTVSGTSESIFISVDLSDEDTDTLSLGFEYSIDDGGQWTSSFSQDRSLLSLPQQTSTTFFWISSQDFTTDETGVRIRVIPTDSKSFGIPLTSDQFSVFNNYEPVAHSLTVTGSTTDILVGVFLSDANLEPLTITFEYSLDAGFNYTQSTNLTPVLSSYPAEQNSTFLWNSSLEFTTDETQVQLRITPSDGKTSGTSAISSVFSVLNNFDPVAQNLTTVGASDDILVSVDLSDGNTDLLSLSFEYTTDASSFVSSLNVTPALTGLNPLAGTTFLWRSSFDFTSDEPTVQIRVTPSDGKTEGVSATSSLFSVLNNHLPLSSNLSLTGTSGDLIVSVDLADEDGDLLTLDFEHSLNDGLSWNETSGTTALTGVIPVNSSTFPWQSSQDFSADETDVRIRLRAEDGEGFGAYTTSSAYQVLNSNNTAPVISDLRFRGNSGAIVVEFSISDAQSDPMSLLLEVSSDSGSNFSTSTNTSHSLQSGLDGTFSKFIWQSSRDFSSDENGVVLRVTPSDSFRSGTGITTGPFSVFNSANYPSQTNQNPRTLIVPSFRIDSIVPDPTDPNNPNPQNVLVHFNREIDTSSFDAIAPLTWNGSNTEAILNDPDTYSAGKFTIFKNLTFQEVRELEAIVDNYITETVPNTDALTTGFSAFTQDKLGTNGVANNPGTGFYRLTTSPFCSTGPVAQCTSRVILGGLLNPAYSAADSYTFFFMPSLSIARSDGLTDYSGNFLAHAVQGYGETTVPIDVYFPLTMGSMRQLHAPTSSDFVFDSQGSLFIPSSAVKTDIKSIPTEALSSLGFATIPSTSTVLSPPPTAYYSPELLSMDASEALTIRQILFSDGDAVVNEALNYISAKNNGALFEHGSAKLGQLQYRPPFSDLPSPVSTRNHIMRPIIMSSSEILSSPPFNVTSIFVGESFTFSVIESFTAQDFSIRYWQKDARLTYQNFYPTLSVTYGDNTTVFTDVMEIRRWRSVTPVIYLTGSSTWSHVPTTGTTTGLVEELVSLFSRDAGIIVVDDVRFKSTGAQIFKEENKEVIGALDIVDGFEWNSDKLPR